MKNIDRTVFEFLAYDSESGVFTWARRPSIRVKCVGAVAGAKTLGGYIQIRCGGKMMYAHRLAWLFVHGCWPSGHIDHINGDKSDNGIANLRDVSRSANSQNQRKAKSNSKTGLLGCHPHQGKFKAEIFVGGKNRHIGCFDLAADAHAAYLIAKRKLHAGCTL